MVTSNAASELRVTSQLAAHSPSVTNTTAMTERKIRKYCNPTVIAIAVGLQYFLIFRSVIAVVFVTLGLCAASWLVTRSSLAAFEVTIRFRLGLLSNESKGIYTEVEA